MLPSRASPPPAATSERDTSGSPKTALRPGDDEVTREHDLESTRQGRTLDRCDQRLGPLAGHDPGEASALGLQLVDLTARRSP